MHERARDFPRDRDRVLHDGPKPLDSVELGHPGERSPYLARKMGVRPGARREAPLPCRVSRGPVPDWEEGPCVTGLHHVGDRQRATCARDGIPRVGIGVRCIDDAGLITDSLHHLLEREPHRDAFLEEQADELRAASAADFLADDDEIRSGLTSSQSTLDRPVIRHRDAIQTHSPGALDDLERPRHGVLRVVCV